MTDWELWQIVVFVVLLVLIAAVLLYIIITFYVWNVRTKKSGRPSEAQQVNSDTKKQLKN